MSTVQRTTLFLATLLAAALAAQAAGAAGAPRKRVAVLRFEVTPALAAATQGWDVAEGFAAQMATALVATGEVTVVERVRAAEVLAEPPLAPLGSDPSLALLPAQFLLAGAVTEASDRTQGRGFGMGLGDGGGLLSGARLGVARDRGRVGIDLRLIEAGSGRVVAAFSAAGEARERRLSLRLERDAVTFGPELFAKTALGQACRQAIEQGAGAVVRALAPLPWTGRVVEVEGDRVFLNGGAESGLAVGQAFLVSRPGRHLLDPDTGRLLGTLEEPVGRVEVQAVAEGFATARRVAGEPPQARDRVRFLPPAR